MTPIPEFLPEVVVKSLGRTATKFLAVLWIATVVATVLGFRWFGPSDRIEHLELRMDSADAARRTMQAHDTQMIRWMCVKSTLKEIALSGLECH